VPPLPTSRRSTWRQPVGRLRPGQVDLRHHRLTPPIRLPRLQRSASVYNYHTRILRHVHSLLSDEVAQTVACSIVASRLDYCNALLYGASTATINKLQRAQNNLARVVCQRAGRTDAVPLLQSLHWVPVHHHVTYKTVVLTHKVLTTSAPSYLSHVLHTAAPARQLRSSATPLLIGPRTRIDIAGRAYSVELSAT